MLNGGGINPDGLSLDLQFAADKTLTARRGPTPAFSRASGATQVGATGLIEYAPENLMLNSGNVSLMSRLNVPVATSQTGGPLGSYYTLGVDAVNDFHIYRNSGVTPAASASSMMWVLAKRGTARYLRIGGGAASTFDWDTLTFSSISTVHSAGDAVAVGDGWYWLPILRGQTSFIDLAPSSSSGVTFIYNETANITVEVAAIQVSRSILLQNTAPDYIPTTTAAVYGPRFDHDPVTLACKGLLIEEGRTNLSRYSGSIVGGSGWNTVGVTSTVSGIAPNGDSSNLVSETTISSDHVAINTGGLGAVPNETSVVSGTTYTASIFVKKAPASIDWIQVSIGAAGFGTSQFANFNISNGSYGNFAGLATGSVPRIEAFPNGWYRCSVTVTANATVSNSAGTLLAFINNTNGTTRLPTYLGSDANSVFAWGAQLEAGSFPTSYIPTTTGTLARSADVCSITGGAFSGLYNQSEGTLLLSADEFRRGTSFLPLLAISNSAGFSANRISIVSYGAKTGNAAPLEFLVTSGGTVQYSAIQTSIPSNFKAALAYKLDDARAALNGALAAADAPPSVSPIGANTLIIGGGGIYISSVRYFRKRLSNEKLQALTV